MFTQIQFASATSERGPGDTCFGVFMPENVRGRLLSLFVTICISSLIMMKKSCLQENTATPDIHILTRAPSPGRYMDQQCRKRSFQQLNPCCRAGKHIVLFELWKGLTIQISRIKTTCIAVDRNRKDEEGLAAQ